MNHGIITRFDEEHGYGFIKDVTGENFFFHINDLCAFAPLPVLCVG